MATSFDKEDSSSGKSSTKTTKKDKTSRRAVAEQMRRRQERNERRQTYLIVGLCVLVAVGIVGAAAWKPVSEAYSRWKYSNIDMSEIGAAADVCGNIETKKAEGNQQHVPSGQNVDYKEAPPAFGPHWNDSNSPAPMDRKFYTASDRPELESLVHNLEHGYTIVWYDETEAGDDQEVEYLQALADKFPGTSNYRHKFIVAPWTSKDGDAFPDGQHIAMTHWSAGGVGKDATGKQVGVWQYCSKVSGAALEKFTFDYPYYDSPEPDGM